jgi:nucleoside-diphosphate-sugar epimerase
MRVFVAGATGAVGQQLVPALVSSGHQVTATTRSPAKLAGLRDSGAQPVLLDGLDAVAVGEAVAMAEPEVVIHEMTAIPSAVSLRHFDRTFAATNVLRTRGIDHLLAAATAAGVRRVIAQSFAGWPYTRSGGPVKTEEDELDPAPPGAQRETFAAIRYLEQAVLSAPLEGIVLRYGSLYGPGTSQEVVSLIQHRQFPIIGAGTGIWSFLHVADAATATVAAADRGAPGVYNVVDDEPAALAYWLPEVAKIISAQPPRHIPVWLGRLAVGEVGVSMTTRIRGASNAKAKRELGWQPAWASWRDGFAHGLTAGQQAGRLAAGDRRDGEQEART